MKVVLGCLVFSSINPTRLAKAFSKQYITAVMRVMPVMDFFSYPDIDECSLGIGYCVNKATCINTAGSYQCICASGYTGIYCETNINECHSNPCLHTSTCIDGINMYTCNCLPGYTGVNCQINIDECNSNPCLNSGTCTDGINEYTCICANGYTGQHCEADIDECLSSPCQHNGQCRNTNGSFYCNCTETGYNGPLCQSGKTIRIITYV